MEFISKETMTSCPCLLSKCSDETRNRLKQKYLYMKKYGIRAACCGVTVNGLILMTKEMCADGVKRHAKRYLGLILVNGGLTSVSAGATILSNSTKVLKYAKGAHSICAASWRVAHNIAEVPFIIVDYAIFGEYVPSCGEADYDVFSDTTDIIKVFVD